MEKKRILDRIQLLNGGREPYLEFLRNLTPQIVLFTLVLILWVKLDFTRIDLNNAQPTITFFVLLGSFALAFYANSTVFYKKCFAELEAWLKEERAQHTSDGIKGLRFFVAMIKSVLQNRFIEFLELATITFFLPIALAGVIAIAIYQYQNILRAMHG